MERIDAVIPRVGTVFPRHAMTILRHLELRGCRSLNSSAAITLAASKADTLDVAQQHRLPIPRSVLVKDLDQVRWGVERVGGPPVR